MPIGHNSQRKTWHIVYRIGILQIFAPAQAPIDNGNQEIESHFFFLLDVHTMDVYLALVSFAAFNVYLMIRWHVMETRTKSGDFRVSLSRNFLGNWTANEMTWKSYFNNKNMKRLYSPFESFRPPPPPFPWTLLLHSFVIIFFIVDFAPLPPRAGSEIPQLRCESRVKRRGCCNISVDDQTKDNQRGIEPFTCDSLVRDTDVCKYKCNDGCRLFV